MHQVRLFTKHFAISNVKFQLKTTQNLLVKYSYENCICPSGPSYTFTFLLQVHLHSIQTLDVNIIVKPKQTTIQNACKIHFKSFLDIYVNFS